mmetsp:Transcript_8287/g.14945  ORF Transcript_8287/g.14945 Transcript_8287/m.14945 type:complete len:218 (-) Transcript_8287:1075-1728(-)
MKLFPLHDIREYQCTSRLQNPLHLRHQHDSVCSVAQRLLAPHKVVLVRPVVGQALIERTLYDSNQVGDTLLVGLLQVVLVLILPKIEARHVASKCLGEESRSPALARSQIKHAHFGSRACPQRSVASGEIGHVCYCIVTGCQEVLFACVENAVVHVVTPSTHNVLVEDHGNVGVILLLDALFQCCDCGFDGVEVLFFQPHKHTPRKLPALNFGKAAV